MRGSVRGAVGGSVGEVGGEGDFEKTLLYMSIRNKVTFGIVYYKKHVI